MHPLTSPAPPVVYRFNRDLFDPPDSPPATSHGPAAYAAAFDAWLAARQQGDALRQASSVAVYRSMWAAFTRWCVAGGLGLQSLRPHDLAAFVHARGQPAGLTDRHAWRLLTLVDAVLLQHARRLGVAPNAAAAELLQHQPQWRHANAAFRNPLPACLTGQQARQLVDWLLDASAAAGDGDVDGDGDGEARPARTWQALRNRCATALQLGGGLTPGDVRAATVAGVQPAVHRLAGPRAGDPAVASGPATPWRIRIPAHGALPEREAPLAPWAGRLLRRWLDRRAERPWPGGLLFPGTTSGRPWAKVSQYQAALSVMAAAGLPHTAGGSFVLRHTFALRQLRRGRPPHEVARWLGLRDPALMARYQRVAFEAEDVV